MKTTTTSMEETTGIILLVCLFMVLLDIAPILAPGVGLIILILALTFGRRHPN